jgi:hypothetical protein
MTVPHCLDIIIIPVALYGLGTHWGHILPDILPAGQINRGQGATGHPHPAEPVEKSAGRPDPGGGALHGLEDLPPGGVEVECRWPGQEVL